MALDQPASSETIGGALGSNAYIDGVYPEGPVETHVDMLDRMSEYESLVYEHPDYVEMLPKWKKYSDCYEAENVHRFIFKHPRESDDMFTVRVKRGYYYNYCASVVDLIVAYMFHAPIERSPGDAIPEEFGKLYDDADLCDSTFENFMQEVATSAQIYGHCAVLVDAPDVGDVENEEERKELGLRPYLTMVSAPQIKDWVLDSKKRFKWVKIELNQDDDRDSSHPVTEQYRHFLIWTRSKWEKWQIDDVNQDAKLVASGENTLGEVPIVVFYNEKSKAHSWFGTSMLRDIADINIAILNWTSLGDEEIAERCLNILTMESNGGDSAEVLSHHNVLEYSPGTAKPDYLVPGETPLELIGKWIDRATDQIYRLSKLSGSTGLLGVREATSGIAYAYEFNETNQSLAKKAKGMEQGEVKLHRLFARWLSKEFDGTIAYPSEFGVDDFLQELQVLTESRTTLSSETAIKTVEKKVTAKMFAREPMYVRAKIKKEIDEADVKSFGFAESFEALSGKLTGGEEPAESGDQDSERLGNQEISDS